ncbi:hypothetical protein EYF80_034653 [Liparis tanakae]|uniref:Uncharacterized protein n=1 Tax=Liparis tanakae TaxID=230148 RepID=A0A4Z2GP46_9TELE|nr:hypothetical protein EYF80_034653 [Liparis tanakae]
MCSEWPERLEAGLCVARLVQATKHHVTPGVDSYSLTMPMSITPTNSPLLTPHHHRGQRALAPSPCDAYGPHQRCPPKRNKTELKRGKMAPRCFPCQSP